MIAERVARLRQAHGESLREASLRTGVSHTTVARIEKGEVTGSFHGTLRKIADGYGVRVEYLMTGRDPKRDFDFTLADLPAHERIRLWFMSPRARIRVLLDFLLSEYADLFTLDMIAEQAGLQSAQVQAALGNWGEAPDQVCMPLGHVLSRLTGIGLEWFWFGAAEGELPNCSAEDADGYTEVLKKAVRSGLKPGMISMAIDLLMLQAEPQRRGSLPDWMDDQPRRAAPALMAAGER